MANDTGADLSARVLAAHSRKGGNANKVLIPAEVILAFFSHQLSFGNLLYAIKLVLTRPFIEVMLSLGADFGAGGIDKMLMV